MKLSRVAGLLFVLGFLFQPAPSPAQTAPAYAFPKQYATRIHVTTKDGHEVSSLIQSDNGKTRTEITMMGKSMIFIARPDQAKVYQLLPDTKTVTQRPLDPVKSQMGVTGPDAKFELIGPDTVGTVACTEYKVTATGKISFLWVDTTKQVPVRLTASDGAYTMDYIGYQAGPQDAALFELPADYQLIPTQETTGAH